MDGVFANDDFEGDLFVVAVLGDGIANYLDLDSDNDSALDLFESGVTDAQIAVLDSERNGIIDVSIAVGVNGLADVLETFPDSGVLNYAIQNTDGDNNLDFMDLTSTGTTFDLYLIGNSALDDLGAGFISRLDDTDRDGIMRVVDTDLVQRGAPGSPLPPW